MKKLLFISPTFPFPEDRGWNVRVSNLLKACSENFSVTLVAPEPEESMRDLHSQICAEFVAVEKYSGPPASDNFLTEFLKEFYVPSDNAQNRYQAAVDRLRLDNFDIIWVERRSQFAPVQRYANKVILDLDDIEHLKLWQQIRLSKSYISKLLALPRLVAIFLWEIFMTRFVRAVVVCSEADKKYLARFGLKNVHVVSNGTSIDIANDAFKTRRLSRAVFLGNMGYPPNIDAIKYFDQKIMPLVLAKNPDFQLDVVGPKPLDIPGLSKRINFLGYAEDLPSTLQSYTVMAVPLRFGGGTKLKVLDAMASGVPVITTSVGAVGLNIESGVHAIVTDTPEEFARQISSLLEKPDLGAKLCTNAHSHVMQKFSWKAIRKDTATWLLQIA